MSSNLEVTLAIIKDGDQVTGLSLTPSAPRDRAVAYCLGGFEREYRAGTAQIECFPNIRAVRISHPRSPNTWKGTVLTLEDQPMRDVQALQDLLRSEDNLVVIQIDGTNTVVLRRKAPAEEPELRVRLALPAGVPLERIHQIRYYPEGGTLWIHYQKDPGQGDTDNLVGTGFNPVEVEYYAALAAFVHVEEHTKWKEWARFIDNREGTPLPSSFLDDSQAYQEYVLALQRPDYEAAYAVRRLAATVQV